MISAPAQLRRLFTWDHWASGVLIATLATTSDAPEETGRVMAHIIGAQNVWLSRIEGTDSALAVWPALDVGDMRAALDDVASRWMRFLESADDALLSREIEYTNSRGDRFRSTVYDIAHQVVTHGAHHRGQINARLREAGHSAPWTDYIQASRTGRLPQL